MSDAEPQPVRRSRVLPGLLLVALVFAGGAGFWAWASQNLFPNNNGVAVLDDVTSSKAIEQAPPPLVVQPGSQSMNTDIASLSDRLRALEAAPSTGTSQSVSIAAERLVLILATRRAAERGAPHVPMASALAASFPSQQSTLIPSIMQNAANPPGLAALVQEFEALKPKLSTNTGSWMDRLSDLAVIRSKGPENPPTSELVNQIESALQRQDFARAAKLLYQHPARSVASQWLARANAHAAAMRALDSLEALAVETPIPMQEPKPDESAPPITSTEN